MPGKCGVLTALECTFVQCTTDTDCPTCGIGECVGNIQCVFPVPEAAYKYCIGNCNSGAPGFEKSCTITCPADGCSGYKWNDYPPTATGTCDSSGNWCNGACDYSSTCDKTRCGAPCVSGETQTQSCTVTPVNPCTGKADGTSCTITTYGPGTQTRSCTSDCVFGSWSACQADVIKTENGKCYSQICVPSGTEVCTDGIDNDGDGLIDCADPDCCGKTGPSNVICCAGASQAAQDACCPAQNNRIGQCRNNVCEWGFCTTNNDCVTGSCCTNQPDGTIEGTCTDPNSRIYNNKWLCDPPEWKSLENNKKGNLNVFQELFYFITGLFRIG